ncbi:hypothetical protein [Bacillus andreraoultii]|uniref:hypothetical protein n=1 Tax=Bacillus andreraoultii TaxID=1499685 RepID=UPI00053AC9A1|nr:hypothetical protein [Bacillus andreraoultii]
MEDIISIIMIFSIPIIAIVTSHMRKQATIKQKLIQDEIELEKLKQSNYLLETEKLRLELEKMQKNDYKNDKNQFI